MPRPCLPAALFLILLARLLPAEEAPARWLYTVQVFTLSKPEGNTLLAADLNDDKLYEHLIQETKTRPELLEKLLMASGDGEETVKLQQAVEFWHPTEFDPQQLPQQVAIGGGNLAGLLLRLMTPAGSAPAEPVVPAQPAPPLLVTPLPPNPINGGLGIITSITPTAFEMKPLGDALELTPQTSAQPGSVEVTVACSHSRLAGFLYYNGEPQALYSDRTINTEVRFNRSRPCLLGTVSAASKTGTEFSSKDSTVSLAFLSARRQPLPPAINPLPAGKYASMIATLEVISLPRPEAAGLVARSLSDAELHAQLHAGIKTGAVRLESLLAGAATSGETSTLEDVDIYTYATEFDPPQMPQMLLLSDDKLLNDLRQGLQTGTGAPDPAFPHNGGFGLMTTATPTAFENKPLGTRIELEPVLQKDGYFSIRCAPTITRLLGERRYNGVPQPVFEELSLTTKILASPDLPVLLGTLSRPTKTGVKEGNEEDRIWLAFLTVRAD